MKINYCQVLCLATAIFSVGCKQETKETSVITGDEIKSHIAVLANDSLTGRKPFTEGETKTIAYISSQFKRQGLEPGNNGSFYQEVPMVEVNSTPTANLSISGAKGNISLNYLADFVASTRQEVPEVRLSKSPPRGDPASAA